MKVSGVSGIGGADMQASQMGMSQEMDAVSRNLQSQIQTLQKQLKELSSNQDMTMEAKMKKRQELQKQISDLEVQLRQHQMELKREERQKKQQAKEQTLDDMLGTKEQKQNGKTGKQNTGLSQTSMKAMISADAAMEQAGVQGGVASEMEGRAGVLEIEIKLDTARGGDPEAKREALAKTKEIAGKATASQLQTLGKANKTMEEAAKAEESKTETDKSQKDKIEKDKLETDKTKQDGDALTADEMKQSGQVSVEEQTWEPYYVPVDVRI